MSTTMILALPMTHELHTQLFLSGTPIASVFQGAADTLAARTHPGRRPRFLRELPAMADHDLHAYGLTLAITEWAIEADPAPVIMEMQTRISDHLMVAPAFELCGYLRNLADDAAMVKHGVGSTATLRSYTVSEEPAALLPGAQTLVRSRWVIRLADREATAAPAGTWRAGTAG